MTDNEIIKALESVKQQYGVDCYVCEYKRICRGKICPFHTCDYALDLISRKKAEIEEQDQAIIKALKHMGEIRSEAIKEFAERLKEKLHLNDMVIGSNCAFVEDFEIDNLVKEMTEGK